MAAEIDRGIEAVISPVVHGQIKSFRHDHGGKVTHGLASSMAKRIINDLSSGETARRLRGAILAAAGTLPVHHVVTPAGSGTAGLPDGPGAGGATTPRLMVRQRNWPRYMPVLARVNGWVWVIPPGNQKGVPRTFWLDDLERMDQLVASGSDGRNFKATPEGSTPSCDANEDQPCASSEYPHGPP